MVCRSPCQGVGQFALRYACSQGLQRSDFHQGFAAIIQAHMKVRRQVVCCVNLTPMHIGSVKSEVRILGVDSPGGVVLLRPDEAVENGIRIY